MKRIFLLSLLSIQISQITICQKVGINTADPKALLHVKGQDANVYLEDIYPLLIQKSEGDTVLIAKENGQLFMSNSVSDHAGLNIRKEGTSSFPHLSLQKNQAGDFATIDFSNNSGQSFYWDFTSGSGFGLSNTGWFVPGYNYLLNMFSNGNIGINKYSPTEKLDIDGEFAMSGALRTSPGAQSGHFMMSGGNSSTKYGTLTSPLLLPQNVMNAYNTGSLVSVINKLVPLAEAFLPPLSGKSKLIIDYNVVLQTLTSGCSPFCGDTELQLTILAKSPTISIPLMSQITVMNSNKSKSFSGRIITEIDPAVFGINDWYYQLGTTLRSGPEFQVRSDFVSPYGRSFIKVKVLPTN